MDTEVRSRNFCFTLNNYEKNEIKILKNFEYKYIIFGFEKGKEGTPHLQGYIEFSNAVRFSTIKKKLPRIHLEKRKGTAAQASDYCKKDGDFFEDGEISKQGARNDLVEIKKKIDEGVKMSDIADDHFGSYVRYHKGFEKYKSLKTEDRTEKPHNTWRWGLTGVGKTFKVFEKHGAENIYVKDGSQWWDGYENQEVILIDDFDHNQWNYRELLRLLDGYKITVQVKGGTVKINSPRIYITCEYPPNKIWSDNKLDQVLRRLDVVTEVRGNTKTLTKPRYEIEEN